MKTLLFTTASVLLVLSLTSARALADDGRVFTETLPQAQGRAKDASAAVKSAQAGFEAAQSASKASFKKLLPNLSLTGSYFYQTNVPSETIPGLGNFTIGANNNYTIGPVLNYTLFAGFQDQKNYQSADVLSQAREADRSVRERNLKLNLNLTYFRAQLALKNVALTADNLALSQAQSRDIGLRFNAGASSKLDHISAERDVMSYLIKFQQAQATLAASLRDLFALTGEGGTKGASRPAPVELRDKYPVGIESATLFVQLDSLETSLQAFSRSQESKAPDLEQPEVKSLALSSDSSRLAGEAQKGAMWPRVSLSFTSVLMYPNSILLQTVNNNVATVNLQFPLYLGDPSHDLGEQHLKESLSYEYQRDQRLTDLSRDFQKTQDLLGNLATQKRLNLQNEQQAGQIAHLTYEAYRTGKVNYLDVQTANLRFLEAKVAAAEIDQEILTNLATLDNLSSPGKATEP